MSNTSGGRTVITFLAGGGKGEVGEDDWEAVSKPPRLEGSLGGFGSVGSSRGSEEKMELKGAEVCF